MNFKKVTHNSQPVRGLWERNGIFYAQITVKKGKVSRKRLEAETVPQAVSELHYVKHGVRLGEIVQHGKDSFADAAARYQADSQHKRAGTVASETSCITRLSASFGVELIRDVNLYNLRAYRTHRQSQGIANSTINTEMSVASKVFQYAIDNGIITENPVSVLSPLKCAKPERKLLSNEDIKKLCEASPLWMCEYIRFLQYTGAREKEALRVRWVDVEFSRNRIHIGADGLAKNGKSRYVEMSEGLRVHLESMNNRLRTLDTLFSPEDFDYRSTLENARKAAGLEWVGFHDFRRHFVSQCVMSGIDFATIANWVGHSDSGALLARKYTFLHSQHVASQAKKLQFS
jgi:integrase